MNWYRNAHFLVSNQVKHYYHDLVHSLLGNQKFYKIELDYKVYVKNKMTDGHNVRAVIEKFFLDGLVNHGMVYDDSVDYVLGDTSHYFIDKLNPRIEIIIKQA